LFNKKNKNEEIVIHHQGTYKFDFPFLTSNLVPNEDNIVPIYYCDVEIHVGEQLDLDEGIIATVIIRPKGNVGMSNFTQDIATNIRKSLFKSIFICHNLNYLNKYISKSMRWLENYADSNSLPANSPTGNWTEVILEWNENKDEYLYVGSQNYNSHYSL
jgi:hypothetical protein